MDRYPGGLPKSFLQPCLLLLVKEQPGYGYDLVTRLKALGIDDDSAAVYRSLRTLEEKGQQDDRLAAREDAQPYQRAEEHAAAPVRGQRRQHHEEPEQRLAHHRAVGRDERAAPR